jgi:hypothetical protein
LIDAMTQREQANTRAEMALRDRIKQLEAQGVKISPDVIPGVRLKRVKGGGWELKLRTASR